MSLSNLPAEIITLISDRVSVADFDCFILINKAAHSSSSSRLKLHRLYRREYSKIQLGPTDFEPLSDRTPYQLGLDLLRDIADDPNKAGYVRHLAVGAIPTGDEKQCYPIGGLNGWVEELCQLVSKLGLQAKLCADLKHDIREVFDDDCGRPEGLRHHILENLTRRLLCQMFVNLQSFQGSDVGITVRGRAALAVEEAFLYPLGPEFKDASCSKLSSLSLTIHQEDSDLLRYLSQLPRLTHLKIYLPEHSIKAIRHDQENEKETPKRKSLKVLDFLFDGFNTSFLTILLPCLPALQTLHFASGQPVSPHTLAYITCYAPRTLEHLSLIAEMEHNIRHCGKDEIRYTEIPWVAIGARRLANFPLKSLQLSTIWLSVQHGGSSTKEKDRSYDVPTMWKYLPKSLEHIGLKIHSGEPVLNGKQMGVLWEGYGRGSSEMLNLKELRLENATAFPAKLEDHFKDKFVQGELIL